MKKIFLITTIFFILLSLCIFSPFVFSYSADIIYELPVLAIEKGPKRNLKSKDKYDLDSTNPNITFNIQQESEEIEQSDYIEKYSYEQEPPENKPEIAEQTNYFYNNEAESAENNIDTYPDDSEKIQSVSIELTEYDDDFYSEVSKDAVLETKHGVEADSKEELLTDSVEYSVNTDIFSLNEEQTSATESSNGYISETETDGIMPSSEDFFYNDEAVTAEAEVEIIAEEYREDEQLVDEDSAYDFIEKAEEEVLVIRENITIPAPADVKDKREQNIYISENLLTNTDNNKIPAKTKEDDKIGSEKTSDYLSFMKSGGGVVKNIHIISKKNSLVAEIIISGSPSGGIVEFFHVNPPNSGIAFDLYGKWKKNIPNKILFRNNMFSYIDVGLHEDRLRLVFRSIRTANNINATVETEILPGLIRIHIINHAKTNNNPVLQN